MSPVNPDRISVRAEMWKDRGEWKLIIRAPEWVVGDFARHASGLDRRVWMHNYGGGMGEYSFLLGTVEMEPYSRRERFARWLLRIPAGRRYRMVRG